MFSIGFKRLIGLATIPLISSLSIVGTGYSLWIFSLPDGETSSGASIDGNLKITGLATTPFQLEILKPIGYDGYRIVYEQGGSTHIDDRTVGVSLSPGSIKCRLTTVSGPIDDESNLVFYFSLSSFSSSGEENTPSDPCLSLIGFASASSSDSPLTSIAFKGSEAIEENSWHEDLDASSSLEDASNVYEFNLNVELCWRENAKPTDAAGWASMASSLLGCANTHQMTITVENGIQ